MTAQATETLNYKDEKLALCEEPLGDYFELAGIEPPFEAPHTALWRGYVGAWEIVDDRLYLVDLKGWTKTGNEVGLDLLFPNFPSRVFAHWVNGTLRATRGKQLKYVHAGYASVYEQDLFFEFADGVLKSFNVRDNSLEDGEG
jgi:hypothetical protein